MSIPSRTYSASAPSISDSSASRSLGGEEVGLSLLLPTQGGLLECLVGVTDRGQVDGLAGLGDPRLEGLIPPVDLLEQPAGLLLVHARFRQERADVPALGPLVPQLGDDLVEPGFQVVVLVDLGEVL